MLTIPGASTAGALGELRAYASWMRCRDILALQGPPMLGAVFAMHELNAGRFGTLLVLAIANLLLVAHIFVLNDWAGAEEDLNDANKRAGAFATKGLGRRSVLRLWIALLVASLGLFGLLGPRAAGFALAIVLLSAVYSAPGLSAKGVPILSSVVHLAGGILHFLLGVALFGPIDRAAIAFGLFCGLAFAAGHLNQEVRDFDGDLANGIRTNAVVFGRRRTFLAGFAVFTAAYAQLLVLGLAGVVPGWLAFLGGLYFVHAYWSWRTLAAGLSFESISRFQTRYRALYAVMGAVLLSTLLVSSSRVERTHPTPMHASAPAVATVGRRRHPTPSRHRPRTGTTHGVVLWQNSPNDI